MRKKMNITLLRNIQSVILEQPLRLNMYDWIEESSRSPCGTVGCIAGHAVLIDTLKKAHKTFKDKKFLKSILPDLRRSYISKDAAKLLGLTKKQASKLYFVADWPEPFKTDYYEIIHEDDYPNAEMITKKSREKLAQITSNRIEYFIDTKK